MRHTMTILFVCSLALTAFFDIAATEEIPDRPLADRVKIPIHMARAYNFAPPAETQPAVAPRLALPSYRRPTRSPGWEIGQTYYDIQHHCSMGRQVEHDERWWPVDHAYDNYARFLSFVWTIQYSEDLGEGTHISHQAYEIQPCAYLYGTGGVLVTGSTSGFAAIDADTAYAVSAGIMDVVGENVPQTFFYLPEGDPYNFASEGPVDIYGYYEGAPNIWPKIEWDTDGIETVLHMVATESASGNARTVSYYRRTGGYGVGSGAWSSQQVIDTVVNISATVAASLATDKVVIVWNAPADYKRDTPDEFSNQYENDVWVAVSYNAGADWLTLAGMSIGQSVDQGIGMGYGASGGNITTYPACGDYKASFDLSALISYNSDNAHIVWGCRRWDCDLDIYRRRSAIFHWSEDVDTITTVVKAEWDTGGSCYAYDMAGDAAKMTIAECNEKLYVLYTQFGNTCDPCVDYDLENNIMNGELYLTASSDSGRQWDRPQNLTNTETPNCEDWNCESEYWPSMARYGRLDTCSESSDEWVLDILYINDLAPGTCLQTESGVWTLNPVMWLTTPCREVVPEPPPFYFVHITDTHIGSVYHLGSDDRLESAVEKINSFNPLPAFVVVSGDLVAYGGDPVGNSNYDRFEEIMAGLDPSIPYYTCPGNHDARYGNGIDNYRNQIRNDTDYVEDMESLGIRLVSMYSGADKSVLAFKKICLWWICGWIIWIDGHPEGAGISGDQYTWLSDRLTERPDLKSILFTHHPIVWCSTKDSYGDAEDNCGNACIRENRGSVWNLMKDPDTDGNDSDAVKVALSGHTHEEDYMYRSDSPTNADLMPLTDWTTSACDTLTGLLPLHVNTGDLADDFSYRVVQMDGQDFRVSRTYFFDRTASAAAFWTRPEEEGKRKNFPAASTATEPAGRVHVWQVSGSDTTHVVGVTDADTIDLLPGATYACYRIEDDSLQLTIWPGENVSIIIDTGIYIMEFTATDSSLLSIQTGYTKENGCRTTFSHIGIPAPAGSVGRLLVYGDYIDTLLYWWDEAGNPIPDTVYPPGNYLSEDCLCLPGDANGDSAINVGDAVYIIAHVFKGGPAPIPFNPCSGDATCDGQINVGDAVYVINYVFKGGPAPCTCEEWLDGLARF